MGASQLTSNRLSLCARDAINILSTAPTSFFRWRRRRAHLESSLGDIHVAKLGLLHATPTRELRAHLPEFAQVAAECLPASDLRRKSLEDLNAKSQFDDTGEGPQDRIRILGTVSDAMRASYAEFERRQLQLFNFAIVVYVAAAIMMTLVICIVAFDSSGQISSISVLCSIQGIEQSACLPDWRPSRQVGIT
jgi:hypothetical protein